MNGVLSLLAALSLGAPASGDVDVRGLDISRLTAVFLENRGQWPGNVRYAMLHRGATVWVETGGLRLALPRGSSVYVDFQGTGDPRVRGEDARAGSWNFLVRRDPSRWRRDVRASGGWGSRMYVRGWTWSCAPRPAA